MKNVLVCAVLLSVLTGCSGRGWLPYAREMEDTALLRTMGPETLAMDEITAREDCEALLHAGWCGVRLVATAHAAAVGDLRNRILYRPLLDAKLFQHILVLRRDKTLHEERVTL